MLNVEIVLHTTTDVYSIGTLLKVSGENNVHHFATESKQVDSLSTYLRSAPTTSK